jgi:hypothetical protein
LSNTTAVQGSATINGLPFAVTAIYYHRGNAKNEMGFRPIAPILAMTLKEVDGASHRNSVVAGSTFNVEATFGGHVVTLDDGWLLEPVSERDPTTGEFNMRLTANHHALRA